MIGRGQFSRPGADRGEGPAGDGEGVDITRRVPFTAVMATMSDAREHYRPPLAAARSAGGGEAIVALNGSYRHCGAARDVGLL